MPVSAIIEEPENEIVSDSQSSGEDEELSLPQFHHANLEPPYEDTFAESYVGPESYKRGALGDNEDSDSQLSQHKGVSLSFFPFPIISDVFNPKIHIIQVQSR